MDKFLKDFRKKNVSKSEDYFKYIKENDWTKAEIERNAENRITYCKYYFIKDNKGQGWEGKEGEYKVQSKLINALLDRLTYFCSKVSEDIGRKSSVDNIIKKMRKPIDHHLKRIDDFTSRSAEFSVDEKDIPDEDEELDEKTFKSQEIEFDSLLYKDQNSIQDKIYKLDLDRQNQEGILELWDNQKATLAIKDLIEREYPKVKEIMDGLKLDFTSPPKNEMLIHIDNPPQWNPDKHYFEQDRDVLQFYIDEYKKIKNGIKIDGVYISPWMYCHLNIFKTDIPSIQINPNTGEKESKDKIMHPPLRDNEWFIIQEEYEKAKRREDGYILFLSATRRAAKTTDIASHLQHTALSGGKELIVAGGSSKDLGQIEKNFKKTMTNADPAFKMMNPTSDWTKRVIFGIKNKNQRTISSCVLEIINLDAAKKKKSEVLAGYTPDAFVLDECMKIPFLEQLNAAKPSFDSPGGKRCVPLLSGTGNANEELVEDALKVLAKPNVYGISQMDFDNLERGIPKELITWTRRNFGTFLPGQMSAKEGLEKIEKTLPEYLGIEPTPKLNKIKIQVTDWKKAIDIITKDRELKSGDKDELIKEKVYYPIDIEEIFLSGKENPFPKEEISNYKARIIEEGDTGKKVVFSYDQNGDVTYDLSNKEYADFPYGGGNHDAPCTIFEDPMDGITFGFFISGLDDYKFDKADSDSVGSFVIVNRFTGNIAASYHSRPESHPYFYEQGLMMIEYFKAPLFMENADMGFKTYTDQLEVTDDYLVESFDLTGKFELSGNTNRKFGWAPTTKNISSLMGYFINTMKKKEIYEDDQGRKRTRWGFEKVKDTRLLDEMIKFKFGGNHDGITAAMSAYFYDYYLQITYGAPQPPLTEEEKRLKQEKLRASRLNRQKRQKNPFPNTSRAGRYW